MKLRMELWRVMKPYRWDGLNTDEKATLMNGNPKWVMERKINGCRLIVVVLEGQPYFFSSHGCVDTYVPTEVDNLLY